MKLLLNIIVKIFPTIRSQVKIALWCKIFVNELSHKTNKSLANIMFHNTYYTQKTEKWWSKLAQTM